MSFEAVPLVDIDDDGRFKYILIKVFGKELADGTEPSKLIVRGYARAEWHGIVLVDCCLFFCKYTDVLIVFTADIYDEVNSSLQCLGLDSECLGGGRIEHYPDVKKLKVFGYSTVSLSLQYKLPNVSLLNTYCRVSEKLIMPRPDVFFRANTMIIQLKSVTRVTNLWKKGFSGIFKHFSICT